MRTEPWRLAVVLALLASPACAPPYRIDVQAFHPEATSQRLPAGSSIHTVPNPMPPDAPDLASEQAVAEAIARLLREKGYRPTSAADAEYYLAYRYGTWGWRRGGVRPPFADYGSSPPKDAPRVASWAAPYLFSFWGYGRPVIIIPRPPPVRWLSLTTLDANELDQDGKYTVLSAITAECQTPIHLPLVIDYLLVAAFEVFGSLSDETIHLDLRPDDPRVMQLR